MRPAYGPNPYASVLPLNPWRGSLSCDVVSRDAHQRRPCNHTSIYLSTPHPNIMLSAHQTEHLGPKSQVSELVHFEHDINSGAVDSVARRIEAYAVGEHAGHAGFPLPKQADSISASGAAALPVQLQLAGATATSSVAAAHFSI